MFGSVSTCQKDHFNSNVSESRHSAPPAKLTRDWRIRIQQRDFLRRSEVAERHEMTVSGHAAISPCGADASNWAKNISQGFLSLVLLLLALLRFICLWGL